MLDEHNVKGIFVPVVTPFLPSGELDLISFQNYVDGLLKSDIQGLVINGTTGESPTVSWEEVILLVEAAKERMQGKRIPIIVGTGTNDTASTLKRTELAGNIGADAALVVVPYYSRPSQAGIIEHFRMAAQVGLPVIAYEVPARTGIRLTVSTARNILELDGVIGLKDSTGGPELLTELTRLGSKPVLCGEDANFYAALCAGASGGILASANIHTDAFIDVFQLVLHGRVQEAKITFDRLFPLIQLLFQESNPAPLKWLLSRQSVITSDTVRLPMTSITRELQSELEQAIAAMTA
ncbi:4-hydroxy-tetrahydrodipicolinate synthase [Paenibacillus sp. sptzw28]|uniref:4-hydroxy-tetrahydrodipicolinate synthase n=1 Tax=Paenibacillus sp. sptzw28 TaxID=715179 RepID=UPI001C6F1E7F|nr:4-hydroxy-tetrahydrodipicolinate synthase [Paenibacillus sp. sptzw28]QYR20206.1 4-hydroxy-tetrahydrodipicolinate synthase [Paenibacillus sp. sptzw28]